MVRDFRHRAKAAIHKFQSEISGATAIEYGLIAAGIGLVLVAVMPAFNSATNNTYSQILAYFSSV